MLSKREIKQLIEEERLVQSYINLDKQLTPNGFDLTAGKIFEFSSCGKLDFSNNERVLAESMEVMAVKDKEEDRYGWWHLKPGVYKVKTNEEVNIPNDLVGFAFSRTSLLRMGAFTQNGVWDSGFIGRSEFILSVQNPAGIKIKENARIVQMVFIKVEETEEYNGIYKNLK